MSKQKERAMPKQIIVKIKWSEDEEERIIDYVRANEVLYNVHHGTYRDAEAKNRIWLKLSQELHKDGKLWE